MTQFANNKRMKINQGVEEFRSGENAVLLDVRSRQEYEEGHIPGSINIPLLEIPDAQDYIPDPDAPVYVYCHSGNRSQHAALALASMGYTSVQNIGGIEDYTGPLQNGEGTL